jgi:hypothetical protein
MSFWRVLNLVVCVGGLLEESFTDRNNWQIRRNIQLPVGQRFIRYVMSENHRCIPESSCDKLIVH